MRNVVVKVKLNTQVYVCVKEEFERAEMLVSRIAANKAKIPLQAASCAALTQSANFTLYTIVPVNWAKHNLRGRERKPTIYIYRPCPCGQWAGFI